MMKVVSKSEVWTVSIEIGDEVYSSHGLDNHTYARIDGNWRHNTGGGIFEWRSCHSYMCKCGCGYTNGELLEAGLQKTQEMREIKLRDILQ